MFRSGSVLEWCSREIPLRQLKSSLARLFRKSLRNLIPRVKGFLQGEVRFDSHSSTPGGWTRLSGHFASDPALKQTPVAERLPRKRRRLTLRLPAESRRRARNSFRSNGLVK